MTDYKVANLDNLKDRPELSIFLPAYAEAENLKVLLPKIKQVINELKVNTQIIVIDAADPVDDTWSICHQNGVDYLPRKGGNRYGDAIRTGILAVDGVFVISMDSDGSHNPEFIRVLWANRQAGDVIIASRYVSGGITENPWGLVAMSQLLNIVFRIFVGIPAYDVSNSYRLYRGDLLRAIQPKYSNFDILEEILVRIIWGRPHQSAKIVEIPFRFEKRKYGRPKRKLIIFAVQFIMALFKLSYLRFKNQFSSED